MDHPMITMSKDPVSEEPEDKPIGEHPQADEIRRQVEFFFSDENLPTDKHLLTLCGGSENNPVSLGQILGWKTMRRYKPKSQVIEALKKSTTLVVEKVNGKYTVRRDLPLVLPDQPSCQTDPTPIFTLPSRKKSINEGDQENPLPLGYYITDRGLVKKGYVPVTGFEEDYVEGPVLPKEAEELYNPDLPVAQRLETAIQRYFRKRKFDVKKRAALNQFLFFGGIENRSRQFTGQSPEDLKEMDKEERELATAVHFVEDEKDDETKWAVDFLGVAQAYFSTYYPEHVIYSVSDIKLVCGVLVNFYSYFLYHNVCPEDSIKQDIEAAREFVKTKVPDELIALKTARHMYPGIFTKACQTLFNPEAWNIPSTEERESSIATIQNSIQLVANPSFTSFFANPKWQEQVKVVKTKTLSSLKVVQIFRSVDQPSVEAKVSSNDQIHSYGILVCKPWTRDDLGATDLPPGQKVSHDVPNEFQVWMDDPILEHCYEGMKIQSDILQLQFGDEAPIGMLGDPLFLCSFYKYILNSMEKEIRMAAHKDTGASDVEEHLDQYQPAGQPASEADSNESPVPDRGDWEQIHTGTANTEVY